jgi:hypothetical protein
MEQKHALALRVAKEAEKMPQPETSCLLSAGDPVSCLRFLETEALPNPLKIARNCASPSPIPQKDSIFRADLPRRLH